MKIAVLSGKGGTGKTMISVNLAASAQQAVYLDCDVEAPNGHLYFKPENLTKEPISVKIPTIREESCTGCRKCVDFCKFNALAFLNHKVMVFEDLCHSCGGCGLVCPEQAIGKKTKGIGLLQSGISENVTVHSGFLNPGQPAGVAIIREVLKRAPADGTLTLIDCPPGSACVVMESIKDADYCVLVAEPTLFGAHNLEMVHELVRIFEKPFGVILNKCLEDAPNPSEDLCEALGLPVIGRIPFDLELGTLNADGVILTRSQARFAARFTELLLKLKEVSGNEAAADSQW